MTQKTYLSKTSKVVSVFVLLLMAGVAVIPYALDKGAIFASVLVLAVMVVICVCAMYYMPTAVSIDDKALTLIFPFRRKAFPLIEITGAELFTATCRMWRLCGSGAFFGWWGWFSAKGVGRFFLYASNLDHLLLIRLANGRKYVISCADPETLSDKINNVRNP